MLLRFVDVLNVLVPVGGSTLLVQWALEFVRIVVCGRKLILGGLSKINFVKECAVCRLEEKKIFVVIGE